MPNYKVVITGAGVWRKGDVVSAKHIEDTNLGGLQRLLDLKAVEETSEKVTVDQATTDPNDPHLTKGDNVDPGSDDTVEKRADRRADAVGVGNSGAPSTGDAAAKANPPTGRPGTVARAKADKE